MHDLIADTLAADIPARLHVIASGTSSHPLTSLGGVDPECRLRSFASSGRSFSDRCPTAALSPRSSSLSHVHIARIAANLEIARRERSQQRFFRTLHALG